MKIFHELKQLDFGGVERVIRNIIKFDKENKHTILAYKDGAYKAELEKVGAKIIMYDDVKEDLICETDILHVHSGGEISRMAMQLHKQFPIIETIHSPIRSPMKNNIITQRVGVTDAVSKINHDCLTIHNGIDLEELMPTKSKDQIKKELRIPTAYSEIPIVGRLGRVAPDKYVEEWLVICNLLQDDEIDFFPLVVGGEATNCPGYLGRLNLIQECLPVHGVLWAGNRSDIANYLQVMDMFLYPSKTEGFGLVFIEALAMGCKIITLDNPVTRELLGNTNAILVNGIDGLVKGVKDSIENRFVKDDFNGRKYVEENFSAKKMSLEYQELYNKVKEGFQINE